MWIKLLILQCLLLFSISSTAQDFGLLSLEVRQEKGNKPISEAQVNISPLGKSFTTDKLGKITVALPFGLYLFEVEATGFPWFTNSFLVNSDTTVTFYLSGEVMFLDGVEITTDRVDTRINQAQISIEKISSEKARRLPVIGGEKDFLKAAAYLPGIQSGAEGSADIVVRGGSVDQNLYLLDNAVLYHTNHLYGFLSSFNPQYISSMDILKGGFPTRFGGKLSSVVDARTVEPTYDYTEGEVSIGLAASSVYLNKPIIEERLNIMVSGRRSYYDLFIPLFEGRDDYEAYNFYDANAKLSWRIDDQNELNFSLYRDRDLYKEIRNTRDSEDYDTLKRTWSNQLFNLGWKAKYRNFNSTFNAYYSAFKTSINEISRRPDEFFEDNFAAHIKDFTIKYAFGLPFNTNWQLHGGAEVNWLNILGAQTSYVQSGFPQEGSRQPLPTNKLRNQHIFAGLHWTKGAWATNVGLRLTQITNDSVNFLSPEPRLNLTYKPGVDKSVKLSYARMSQPLHLLTNPGLGMPIDLYVAPDQDFIPGLSDQLSLGYNAHYTWFNNHFNINIEGYYKEMRNIIEYQDGYSSHIFTNPTLSRVQSLENVLTQGSGKSYGLELFVDKTSGKWKGSLAYTLSWTKHQFDMLNGGQAFAARQDRRHSLAINLNYQLNDHWSFQSAWQYMSGQPVTIPNFTYPAPTFGFSDGYMIWSVLNLALLDQGGRNSYRMKDFHSLNISFQRKVKWKKLRGSLDLGIYNLYNRRNPYFYILEQSIDTMSMGDERKLRNVLKSVSIFPIIPSVTYRLEF